MKEDKENKKEDKKESKKEDKKAKTNAQVKVDTDNREVSRDIAKSAKSSTTGNFIALTRMYTVLDRSTYEALLTSFKIHHF